MVTRHSTSSQRPCDRTLGNQIRLFPIICGWQSKRKLAKPMDTSMKKHSLRLTAGSSMYGLKHHVFPQSSHFGCQPQLPWPPLRGIGSTEPRVRPSAPFPKSKRLPGGLRRGGRHPAGAAGPWPACLARVARGRPRRRDPALDRLDRGGELRVSRGRLRLRDGGLGGVKSGGRRKLGRRDLGEECWVCWRLICSGPLQRVETHFEVQYTSSSLRFPQANSTGAGIHP